MTTDPKDKVHFTGTWSVIESPDFDDESLHIETAPSVILRQTGDPVEGKHPIGRPSGDWEGRLPGAQTKRLRELLKQ